MNRGSAESLKVSVRCGCRPKARQIRFTVAELMPHAFAIERVLHCVAPRGIDSSVIVTTRSTSASLTVRGAPGLGSSRRPSHPFSMNRRRHLPTVSRVVPSRAATPMSRSPSADAKYDPGAQRPAPVRSWTAAASVPALPVVRRRSPGPLACGDSP